jgi:selenoprotein W-related protein
VIARLTLLPSRGGRFEVSLDGELLFSKAALERHARPGEVQALVAARLGPPTAREASH